MPSTRSSRIPDPIGVEGEDEATQASPSNRFPVSDGILSNRDTGNQRSGSMTASEVFDGTWTEISRHGAIFVRYLSSHAPTAGEANTRIEFSDDGSTHNGASVGMVQRESGGFFVGTSTVNNNLFGGKYYRVHYVNGATPSTFTFIFAQVSKHPATGSVDSLDGLLNDLTQALLTRSVIAGILPDDSFGNAGLTEQSDQRVGFQAVDDANNVASAAAVDAYLGTPFLDEANLSQYSGSPIPSAPADTWLAPDWTPVANYAGFSLDALATQVGQGYAIWSTDGTNVSRIESTLFAGAGAFSDPPQGSRFFRIAFQNRSASAGTFTLSTQLRYSPQNLFMFPAGAPVDPSFPAALFKGIITGAQPDGNYEDEPLSGSVAGNTTVALLGATGVFTGTAGDPDKYASITVTVNASHASVTDGLVVEFSNDAFATIAYSQSYTYRAEDAGIGRSYTVPALRGVQYRVKYTNGATPQTAFDLRTTLSTSVDQPLSDDLGRGTTLVSPGLRISQVFGRRHAEASVVGATASGNIDIKDEFGVSTSTVPAGHVFFVTSITGSMQNADTGNAGNGRIRDGSATGDLKYPFRVAEAMGGLGGVVETATFGESYSEPLRFESSVFFQEVIGTLTLDIVLVGYLEPIT